MKINTRTTEQMLESILARIKDKEYKAGSYNKKTYKIIHPISLEKQVESYLQDVRVYIAEMKDHEEITGYKTPEEREAADKAAEEKENTIVNWIKRWKYTTNSAMGALLMEKFKKWKDDQKESNEEESNQKKDNFKAKGKNS